MELSGAAAINYIVHHNNRAHIIDKHQHIHYGPGHDHIIHEHDGAPDHDHALCDDYDSRTEYGAAVYPTRGDS